MAADFTNGCYLGFFSRLMSFSERGDMQAKICAWIMKCFILLKHQPIHLPHKWCHGLRIKAFIRLHLESHQNASFVKYPPREVLVCLLRI